MKLLAQALADQQLYHDASIAAIRAREADIVELERFAIAAAARGHRVRPYVWAQRTPGGLPTCQMVLSLDCTRVGYAAFRDWLMRDGIAATKRVDVGESSEVCELALGRQTVDLMVHFMPAPALSAPATLRTCAR